MLAVRIQTKSLTISAELIAAPQKQKLCCNHVQCNKKKKSLTLGSSSDDDKLRVKKFVSCGMWCGEKLMAKHLRRFAHNTKSSKIVILLLFSSLLVIKHIDWCNFGFSSLSLSVARFDIERLVEYFQKKVPACVHISESVCIHISSVRRKMYSLCV